MAIQRNAKVVYRKVTKIIFGTTFFSFIVGYVIGIWVSVLLIYIKEYFDL